jgi:hypothetical protein
MKTKKPSVYKLYDSYTSQEYYFTDRAKAKLFGEKLLRNDGDDNFSSRFELYKISIKG